MSYSVQKLEEDLTVLESMVEKLTDFFNELVVGNAAAEPAVDNAVEHARKLSEQAEDLER